MQRTKRGKQANGTAGAAKVSHQQTGSTVVTRKRKQQDDQHIAAPARPLDTPIVEKTTRSRPQTALKRKVPVGKSAGAAAAAAQTIVAAAAALSNNGSSISTVTEQGVYMQPAATTAATADLADTSTHDAEAKPALSAGGATVPALVPASQATTATAVGPAAHGRTSARCRSAGPIAANSPNPQGKQGQQQINHWEEQQESKQQQLEPACSAAAAADAKAPAHSPSQSQSATSGLVEDGVEQQPVVEHAAVTKLQQLSQEGSSPQKQHKLGSKAPHQQTKAECAAAPDAPAAVAAAASEQDVNAENAAALEAAAPETSATAGAAADSAQPAEQQPKSPIVPCSVLPAPTPLPPPSSLEGTNVIDEYQHYLERWAAGVTIVQRWHRLAGKGKLEDIQADWEEWQQDLVLLQLQRQLQQGKGDEQQQHQQQPGVAGSSKGNRRAREHEQVDSEDVLEPPQARKRRAPAALQGLQVEAPTKSAPPAPAAIKTNAVIVHEQTPSSRIRPTTAAAAAVVAVVQGNAAGENSSKDQQQQSVNKRQQAGQQNSMNNRVGAENAQHPGFAAEYEVVEQNSAKQQRNRVAAMCSSLIGEGAGGMAQQMVL